MFVLRGCGVYGTISECIFFKLLAGCLAWEIQLRLLTVLLYMLQFMRKYFLALDAGLKTPAIIYVNYVQAVGGMCIGFAAF